MNSRATIAATCSALAISMARSASVLMTKGPIVEKKFEAASPNSCSKSLIAVEVYYPPGATSAPTRMRVGFHLGPCNLGCDRVEDG